MIPLTELVYRIFTRTSAPGRTGGSRPSPPLGTVRDSFPSYGSSLPIRATGWVGPGSGAALPTPYAIRHCSLLTSRRAVDQTVSFLLAASSLGAPAEAVLCFPICEGSPVCLASEHLSDVGTLSPGPSLIRDFAMSRRAALSVPLQDDIRFFRPLTTVPPWACLTVGLPCYASWRTNGLSTFHVIDFTDDVGGI